MSVISTSPVFTPNDLLTLPVTEGCELVDGRLVERNMGYLSVWIANELHVLLRNFAKLHDLGWAATGEAAFQCFPNAPTKVRRPDVSFICRGRLPGERLPKGHARIAPDLVVEVISPNDLCEELNQKIEEYFSAGVRLIWIVSPETRSAVVWRLDGSGLRLSEQDEFSGEDVLPGFKARVGEILPPPEQIASDDNGSA